jgi:hypothetical protein
MSTLFLLGALITLQWGPPCGLSGDYNLMFGTPTPVDQPKETVQLYFQVAVPAAPCSYKQQFVTGTYIIALQSQNPASVPFESNRVKLIVFPDDSYWTDTPPIPPGGITPPSNFRFP